MQTILLMAQKTNLIAGIVAFIFIAAMAYRYYLQDEKDKRNNDYDRWNDPENWRPH